MLFSLSLSIKFNFYGVCKQFYDAEYISAKFVFSFKLQPKVRIKLLYMYIIISY